LDSSVLLDAGAFYAGVPFGSTSGSIVYATTPQVHNEVSHIKGSHGAVDALLLAGRLQIVEPRPSYVDAARRAAQKTGDLPNVSVPDISIIALCMQTGYRLITDDYAVSNVLQSIGLDVTPVMTSGIRDVGRWFYYCPGCGGTGGGRGGRECSVCGTALKRRLVKRQ